MAQACQRLRLAGQRRCIFVPSREFCSSDCDACETVTGRRPAYSTTGGTSDARFIKDIANVAEFGMVGRTMHQVDEQSKSPT